MILLFTMCHYISVSRIPDPDGQLHFYFLPVGQGDTTVIQCPEGQLGIYDMGSTSRASSRFWKADKLLTFYPTRPTKFRASW